MSRYRMEDGSIIDTAKASQRWDEGRRWDGRNLISIERPDSQAAERRLHPTDCDSPDLQGWDGYVSDSYFSGMVVRFARDDRGHIDGERVTVGSYCG